MRALIAVAALVLLEASSVAQAACANQTGRCVDAASTLGTSGTCTTEWFKNKISSPGTLTSDIYRQMYAECSDEGAQSGANDGCCNDPCFAKSGTDECSRDSNCAALPKDNKVFSSTCTGSNCLGAETICVNHDKLCGMLEVGDGAGDASTNQCGLYGFCYNDGGVCKFVVPSSNSGAASTLAPGDDVANKCGALHPMVVAMLVLMFVTLVGAIIIVGVIVVINQRKADAEDAAAGKGGR